MGSLEREWADQLYPYRRLSMVMWAVVGWVWGALLALLWVGPNPCG